jgi:hypothetical protein
MAGGTPANPATLVRQMPSPPGVPTKSVGIGLADHVLT